MAESKPTTRPQRWLPRFSLAALFVLVTLSAIGTWYWYQLPFEVRNVTFAQSAGTGPFAPSGSSPPNGTSQVVRLEIESVRRVWSRDKPTIRQGPWKVYDGRDVLLEEGYYRNGVKHGRFASYNGSGKLTSESHFISGKLHGQSRRWTTKGELVEETNYDHGQLHGRYFVARRITRGGPEPSVTGQYEHGRPAGQWTWTVSLGLPLADRLGTLVGQWREGLPDGVWTCRAGDQIYYTAEFDRGRVVKSSAGRFEPRLAELLAQGKLTDPQVVGDLLKPVTFEFDAVPLNEVIHYLATEAEASILLGLDDELSFAEVERLFPPNHPRRPIRAWEWPLTGAGDNVPLVVALDRLLSPHALAGDYRYGVLWIERARSLPNWIDATGVSKLRPPAGSYLAETWNRPDPIPMEFVETPLKDALAYMSDVHGGGLKFDFVGFPPRMPGQVRIAHGAPDIDSPVTIHARDLPFKHSLGLLLELTGCQATLRGETIVVAPQARQ